MLKLGFLFLISLILPLASAQTEKGRFISDRPGATDSPHAADLGKFRVEMAVFSHTVDQEERTQSYATAALIGGVGANTEVQLGNDGFAKGPGDTSGFGDPTLRVKHNIWGNTDESKSAVAILPFITGVGGSKEVGNDRVVYGLNIPTSWELAENYSLDIMPIWRRSRDPITDKHTNEGSVASVFGYSATDNLDFFMNFVTRADLDRISGFSSFYGGGAAYRPRSDFQVDLELNDGLNPGENEFQIATGFTFIVN